MGVFSLIDSKLYSDFCFLKIIFNKFHYTDNRKGSPYHYFAYVEKGAAKIVTKEKTIQANAGDLLYIPKNTSYQSYWYGTNEISFFSYGCRNLLAVDTNFLDLQVVKCPEELTFKLVTISTDGTRIHAKDIGDFFITIAALLPYMEQKPISPAKNVLLQAKKHLIDNPHCSNEQLAEKCAISLPYLYKIFKNIENETPNTYRQKVLCNEAKDILRTTDISIEEISNILKFSSSGYFREIFKKHTGMTPREFRKLHSF